MSDRKNYDILFHGRENARRIEAEEMDGEIRAISGGYLEDASPSPGPAVAGHFLSVPLENAAEFIDFYAVYPDGDRKLICKRGANR